MTWPFMDKSYGPVAATRTQAWPQPGGTRTTVDAVSRPEAASLASTWPSVGVVKASAGTSTSRRSDHAGALVAPTHPAVLTSGSLNVPDSGNAWAVNATLVVESQSPGLVPITTVPAPKFSSIRAWKEGARLARFTTSRPMVFIPRSSAGNKSNVSTCSGTAWPVAAGARLAWAAYGGSSGGAADTEAVQVRRDRLVGVDPQRRRQGQGRNGKERRKNARAPGSGERAQAWPANG